MHISEESSNAATAVPWAIVNTVAVSGVLGWGTFNYYLEIVVMAPIDLEPAAINMALAFCMGDDLQSLVNSNQPMAQILLNAFGLEATLGIWAIVIVAQ